MKTIPVLAAFFSLALLATAPAADDAKEKQQQELLQQQKQEMHELRRQAEILKENLQAVPAAKRAEIEARLREVEAELERLRQATS